VLVLVDDMLEGAILGMLVFGMLVLVGVDGAVGMFVLVLVHDVLVGVNVRYSAGMLVFVDVLGGAVFDRHAKTYSM
jgi:hypothetical protein